MPLTVSDFLDVSTEAFDLTGAFNPLLDFDSRFYIDPHLLSSIKVPEFLGAREKMDRHFEAIFNLLRMSKREGDAHWERACSMLQFSEAKGLCIGMSAIGTRGNGIGDGLSRQMATTAQRLIDRGADHPRLFEVLGFFEMNIAEDRISDMTAQILNDDLRRFSARVLRELAPTGSSVVARLVRHNELPRNPYTGGEILFVPRDILRHLPTALDWARTDYVQFKSALSLRRIGDEIRVRRGSKASRTAFVRPSWPQIQAVAKGKLRALMLEEPELFESLMSAYLARRPEPYDFTRDPLGEIGWVRDIRAHVKRAPLHAAISEGDGWDVAQGIAEQFKSLLERHVEKQVLYRGSKVKPERAFQRLYQAMTKLYLDRGDSRVRCTFSNGAMTAFKGTQRVVHTYVHLADAIDPMAVRRLSHGNHYLFLIINHSTGYEQDIKSVREAIKDLQARGAKVDLIVVDARHWVFTRTIRPQPAPLPAPKPTPKPTVLNTPKSKVSLALAPASPGKVHCQSCKQEFRPSTLFAHLMKDHQFDPTSLLEQVVREIARQHAKVAYINRPLTFGGQVPCPLCGRSCSWAGVLEHLLAVHDMSAAPVLARLDQQPPPTSQIPSLEATLTVPKAPKPASILPKSYSPGHLKNLMTKLYTTKSGSYAMLHEKLRNEGYGPHLIKVRLLERYLLQRLLELEGIDHHHPDVSRYHKEIEAFVDETLKRKPSKTKQQTRVWRP